MRPKRLRSKQRFVFDLKRQRARIDVTLAAFRATYSDFGAGGQVPRGVAGPDDAWNSEFSGDNCCVGRASALIGNNRGHAPHDGFPIGVGIRGDQDLTRLHFVEFAYIGYDSDPPHADLFADGLSTDQWRARFHLQVINVGRYFRGFRRMDGFRPRLDNMQLFGHAIFGSLDVHRLRMPGEI